MRTIYLIGCGDGTPENLTKAGRDAIRGSDTVFGSKRLLEESGICRAGYLEGKRLAATWKPEEILEELGISGQEPERAAEGDRAVLPGSSGAQGEQIAVLYSGDTGCFSGARQLRELLEQRGAAAGYEARTLPGISSLQLFSARIGIPWEDWECCSVHGREQDPCHAYLRARCDVLFFTDGNWTPARIAQAFVERGWGAVPALAGADLGLEGEHMFSGTMGELAQVSCGSSVDTGEPCRRTAGLVCSGNALLLARFLPQAHMNLRQNLLDSEFERVEGVPMTTQEVRWAIAGHLDPGIRDTVWDIGGGSGSVSIELSRRACYGRVFSVEYQPRALSCMEKNRDKLLAANLKIVAGRAPEVCACLPPPDEVFIGGSGGKLWECLEAVLQKNAEAKIVVSAILVETLVEAVSFFRERGLSYEVITVSAARSVELRGVGELEISQPRHMMKSSNAIYLIKRTR